jgi:hypothetical protein
MAIAGEAEWGEQRPVADAASRWRVEAAASGRGRGGRGRYGGRGRGESSRNGREVGNVLDDAWMNWGAESIEDLKRPQGY